MPRFIIERSVPGLTREELMAAGRRSVAALAELPDVRWIRSYVSDAEGKIYCEDRCAEPRVDSRTCAASGVARGPNLRWPSKSTPPCSCDALAYPQRGDSSGLIPSSVFATIS